MSATMSTVRKDSLVKEDERDVAHVQKADDGRRQPSDNVAHWLALQALRVRPASAGADLGKLSMVEEARHLITCRHSTADSEYECIAASSRGEGQPTGHSNEPVVAKGKDSTDTRRFKGRAKSPTASDRLGQARGLRKLQSQRGRPKGATDPLVIITGGSKHKRDRLAFQDPISQSVIEVETSGAAWATHSVSEHSMPSSEFVSYNEAEPYNDNTKSDAAMCGLGFSHFDFTNPLSTSETASQRDPTSFDVASQGLGTQFERSSPVSCSLESVTLRTKDEAESISDGVTRGRGRPLSSLLRSSGSQIPAYMSYIECLGRDASRELSSLKHECGSQVPYDISYNDEGFKGFDDLEEDDGGWFELQR